MSVYLARYAARVMFLQEIGDLNNIRPYGPVVTGMSSTGPEARFDADGHPVVVNYTNMNDHISRLTSPPPGLKTLVNVGFTVDGNESQIVGSNFTRHQFNRIFRTVRDTVMDFLRDAGVDMLTHHQEPRRPRTKKRKKR